MRAQESFTHLIQS